MTSNSEILLRAILSSIGRQTFPINVLNEIIDPKGTAKKQIQAYNLCDGVHTQGQIVKKLKLDSGNFSRTVTRWSENGIVFRLGDGRDAKLLHIYPLPEQKDKAKK